MLFLFGLVTECCSQLHINYTKKFGVWHLVQGRIECWRKTFFFQARMTPSQSLMATDGALNLNYASAVFVDGVQINNSLATVTVCRTRGLW